MQTYKADFDADSLIAFLNEEEMHHIINVMRMGNGDVVRVCNAEGRVGIGRLSFAGKKSVNVVLEENNFVPPKLLNYELYVAPTKQMDRYEWMIEKATEMGCSAIIPLITTHTERHHINIERLEKISIAAMKQSLRPRKCDIKPALSFSSMLQNLSGNAKDTLFCHWVDEATPSIGSAVSRRIAENKERLLRVIVGPEGDFSVGEVAQMQECGFECVILGTNRLRTETAAIFAASSIYQWQ